MYDLSPYATWLRSIELRNVTPSTSSYNIVPANPVTRHRGRSRIVDVSSTYYRTPSMSYPVLIGHTPNTIVPGSYGPVPA